MDLFLIFKIQIKLFLLKLKKKELFLINYNLLQLFNVFFINIKKNLYKINLMNKN